MKRKKVIAVGLAMAMSLTLFSGCSIKTDTPIIGKLVGLSSDEIFEVDELICTKPEYMLVLMDTQNKYKRDFGGSVDWNAKVDKNTTLKSYVMEKVKEDITVNYTLAAMAKNKGIKLTAEEQMKIEDSVKEYYDALTDAERKYTGAKKEDVEKVYTNYKLASKVYDSITVNIGKDISDEEARVIKIQYIHMSSSNTKENKINNTLQDVIDLVNGGYQEFSREAKQYSEDELVEKIIKKNKATENYEKEAFNLNDGQMSSIIVEGKEYYLVYCVESYMKDETAANKQSIIDESKETYFNQEYSKYLDKIETDFNTSAWEKLKLSNDSNVKTANLFE